MRRPLPFLRNTGKPRSRFAVWAGFALGWLGSSPQVVERHRLKEISHSKLDFEDRLEEWLEQDISVLSDDLLVIGRQVETGSGGYIDLLCIDHEADLVIVELKRDKTPRDITGQALDYASWVEELSNDRVTEVADKYLTAMVGKSLEVAFKEKFGEDLPETEPKKGSGVLHRKDS